MSVGEQFAEIFRLTFDISINTSINDKKHNKKIIGIVSRMNTLYDDIIDMKDTKMDEIVVLAESYLHLAHTYISGDDEEVILALSSIMKCKNLLKGRELNHKFILTAVNACHQLGLVHHKLNNHNSSLSAYNEAFQIYLSYTKKGEMYLAPFCVPSYFDFRHSDPKDMLDKKFALSMQAFMKEYACLDTHTVTEQKRLDEIAMYQHQILEKKLNNLSTDYCTWAALAGSLCEYFVTHNRFTEARDHLAAASLIIKKFYEIIHVETDEPENSAAETEFKIYEKSRKKKLMSVLIAKHWAKYGIQLLCSSKERILYGNTDKKYDNMDNKLCTVCNLKLLFPVYSKEKSNKFLTFANMKKDLREFTCTITDKYLSDYIDANVVFETVMKHLNEAKEYYTLKTRPTAYVSTMLNISQLYKHLTFFIDRSIKLNIQKQRLYILLSILEKIEIECEIYTWPLLIETIITANDILDIMYENFRLQSCQLKISSIAESIKELSTEISEILKSCMKLCNNLYLNLAK